jgi:AcrR family transcriptional regulator
MSKSPRSVCDRADATPKLRVRKFAVAQVAVDAVAVTSRPGLRERKKQATREALRAAALRLALERGPENLRVDDIAEAAGVSTRTYNNYFASREQAIVAGVTAEREARVAAAVVQRPPGTVLSDAVIDAVVEQYTAPVASGADGLLLVTTNPALRNAYLEAGAALEEPLAAAIVERAGDVDRMTARVLAAAVAAATRIALHEWLRAAGGGLVVPSGPLPDLLRAALAPLRPALDDV